MNQDLLTLQPERPLIITSEIELIRFYHDTDVKAAVEQMIAGTYVLVEEYYSNGLRDFGGTQTNAFSVLHR